LFAGEGKIHRGDLLWLGATIFLPEYSRAGILNVTQAYHMQKTA